MALSATRRRFLEVSAAAAAAWLAPPAPARSWTSAAAGGDTLLGTVPFVGEGAFPLDETVGSGLGRRRALDLSTLTPAEPVTSQERFFIRTGCPEALPSPSTWKVRVRGLVETPLDLDVQALEREAGDLGPHLLECAGNSRAAHFGFMSVAQWTGVPLVRVLDRVRVLPRASRVLVSGFDKHSVQDPGSVPGASWIFGLEEVRGAGAFLATAMDGAALSPDHGYPLRLVVPGWYGCTAIKWVDEIALVDDDAPATDQMHEYAGRTHQDPAGPRDAALMRAGQRPEGPRLARDFHPAVIDPAAAPVRVEMRGAADGTVSYRILGIVWGARAPVGALRIRVRPDAPFAPVDEIAGGTAGAWTFWSHTFRPTVPGRHRIELAIGAPGVRARRLDVGYYAREIDIARV